MTTGGGTRAQTTMKSFRLVEELSKRGPVGVSDLASALGMAKSTVHNHLNTLVDCGYAVKDGTEYRLGLRFLDLGGLTRFRMDLYQSARPKMVSLASSSGQVVILTVEESGEGIILDHVGHISTNSPWYTGKRFPLLGAPEGDAILAFLPNDRIDTIVRDHEGLDPDEIREHLADVREQGYSSSFTAQRAEVRRVATPLRRGDGVVLGSLCLCLRADADSDHSESEAVELVRSTAQEIELNVERPRFGSENVITPKHSLSSYSTHTAFERGNED